MKPLCIALCPADGIGPTVFDGAADVPGARVERIIPNLKDDCS